MRANSLMRSALSGAAVAIAAGAVSLEAQAVGTYRFDPMSGSYFVTIATASGLRELQVYPANGVRAAVRPTATAIAPHAWRYEYTLVIAADTRQALSEFELPCVRKFGPPRDFRGTAYSATLGAKRIATDVRRYQDRDACSGVPVFLSAGDSLTVGMTMDAAPGFAPMHLFGKVPAVVWPEAAGGSDNTRAEFVTDSIGGITGGWYEITTVVPLRSESSISTPARSVQALSDDLSAACGSFALIAPTGICKSLRAKLKAATDAIVRGNTAAAVGPVGAVLLELDAQRGKSVSETGYAVLHALGLLLQRQLAP